jgi:hypothetical protein
VKKKPTTWTADRVASEIRALRASGIVPSQSYVVKHRADLYGAAQRYCGGFRSALILAGEDPKEVAADSRAKANTARLKWTRAAILKVIQERHAAGEPINTLAVKQAGLGGLYRAACRSFGSYAKAVEAAGIEYAEVRKINPDWSRDTVVKAINGMAAAGRDLNVSATQHYQGSLVTAAYKLFGSWDAALREAGHDPKAIRLDIDTESGKGRAFENLCNALFSVIRPHWRLDFRFQTDTGPLLPDAYDPSVDEWIDFKLAAWGMSVSSSIRKYSAHARTLRFITLHGVRASESEITFQSVFDFEREANTPVLQDIFETLHGLESDVVPSTRLEIWARVWTEEKLLKFIRELPDKDLNAHSVQQCYPREYSAVVRHFGGWYQGLDAGGLAPDDIRRRRLAYTKEDIDGFIKSRKASGDTLSAKKVTATPSGNGLYQAAVRIYGSWRDALAASGVALEDISEFTLSKEATLARVLGFIRERHTAGEPLNALLIRDNFKAEYGVACRLAGGWRQAVEAAGINYATVSAIAPPVRLGKTDIDSYIQRRHQAGLALNSTAVRRDNRPIHTAACRVVYGSWKEAIEANGIRYADVKQK